MVVQILFMESHLQYRQLFIQNAYDIKYTFDHKKEHTLQVD